MIIFLSSIIQAVRGLQRGRSPTISAILLVLGFGFAAASSTAQAADPFQRYMKITNNLPVTVYPVIQSPLAANGGASTDIRDARLFINSGAAGAGIPTGKTVLVNIPKNGVGPYSWYQAERIYLFAANPMTIEQRVNDPNMLTTRDNPQMPNPCPNEPAGACWSGIANAAYWKDAPAQIIEYTVISKDWTNTAIDPKTGEKSGAWPNPDDTRGVPFIDIDVSYVDDVYLPVVMQLDDGGATGYMGTTLGIDPFITRTNNFVTNPRFGWQNYAAYSAYNWPNNRFNDLVPRTAHVPSGFNIIEEPLVNAASGLYKALPPPNTPKACSAWPGCSNLAGDCCPATDGTVLGCCGLNNFMIDNTTFVGNTPWNPSIDAIYARWDKWISGNPCTDISTINSWPSNNPQFDKQAFCNAFRTTVQWAANTYLNDPAAQAACTKFAGTSQYKYCMLAVIIGYKVGPKAGQQPETVQALLRNIPWGDGKPTLQYQWDKFLQYWAPYDSIFNLNPYVTGVKDTNGVAALSGYSFSIDDLWGNYQDRASGFIVSIGGTGTPSVLLNGDTFDPYAKYQVVFAPGWDHATVCGNPVQLNQISMPISFSFWQNGQIVPYCDIVAYPTAANNVYFKYRVVESRTTVVDTWTGLSQNVKGFKAADPNFCASNSTPTMVSICDPSRTTLTPAIPDNNGKGLENVYVSVDAGARPIVYMNMPPPPTN